MARRTERDRDIFDGRGGRSCRRRRRRHRRHGLCGQNYSVAPNDDDSNDNNLARQR